MSTWKNMEALRADGWSFQNYGTCRYCGGEMEWWKNERGGMLPFDPMNSASAKAIPHKETCTEVKN